MPPDVPRVLSWDSVRRLYVQTVGSALSVAGFGQAGRTMWRAREEFVDVIDCRCNKWNTAAQVSFGCSLRYYAKRRFKPWHCEFSKQDDFPWPSQLLEFKKTDAAQREAFQTLTPMIIAEASRWFALLSDLETATESANGNTLAGPASVGMFNVPSPCHSDISEKLHARINANGGKTS